MNTRFRALDVAVIGVCAALYAAFGILTANVSFFGVGFLPAVLIPAVFAVLYGPWVGGISGALGIFIRDMFVHGNAALSLVAGVPANFILFFLIGYISYRQISLRQALAGITISSICLLVPTFVFLPDIEALTGLSAEVIIVAFAGTVILSQAAIAVVAIKWKEWRSYAIGAVAGQAIGAGLLSITVWAVSPYFLSYFGVPFAAALVIPLFIWTFVTELPFILLVGPPIIKACYKAFPNLKNRNPTVKAP